MSLAVSFTSFWSWVTGIFRKVRREKRKKVSLSLSLSGSVKRRESVEIGVVGSVMQPVSLTLSVIGRISKQSLWFVLDELLGLFHEEEDD